MTFDAFACWTSEFIFLIFWQELYIIIGEANYTTGLTWKCKKSINVYFPAIF